MRWLIHTTFLCLAALAACSDSKPASNDAPIDAAPDPCAACRSDQLCVARFDGVCNLQVVCVAKTVDCPNNTCSTTCQTAYCPQPYQCMNRSCANPPAGAFVCQGP